MTDLVTRLRALAADLASIAPIPRQQLIESIREAADALAAWEILGSQYVTRLEASEMGRAALKAQYDTDSDTIRDLNAKLAVAEQVSKNWCDAAERQKSIADTADRYADSLKIRAEKAEAKLVEAERELHKRTSDHGQDQGRWNEQHAQQHRVNGELAKRAEKAEAKLVEAETRRDAFDEGWKREMSLRGDNLLEIDDLKAKLAKAERDINSLHREADALDERAERAEAEAAALREAFNRITGELADAGYKLAARKLQEALSQPGPGAALLERVKRLEAVAEAARAFSGLGSANSKELKEALAALEEKP